MQQEEALQRVRGMLSLVLDTTYCSPQHLFPPQLQVSPTDSLCYAEQCDYPRTAVEVMSHCTAFIALLRYRSSWGIYSCRSGLTIVGT